MNWISEPVTMFFIYRAVKTSNITSVLSTSHINISYISIFSWFLFFVKNFSIREVHTFLPFLQLLPFVLGFYVYKQVIVFPFISEYVYAWCLLHYDCFPRTKWQCEYIVVCIAVWGIGPTV
jgi:hypothetical protein